MEDDDENALIRRVSENIHTAVLLFDESLRLRHINPAGELLLSLSSNQVIGAGIEVVLSSGELVGKLRHVLESGHPITERELSLLLAHQQRITIDFTATPMIGVEGRRELLVEMTQVDRQLRIVREEGLLAQSSASRALVRGLAHEIKNPLGGLRGAAQLLERELQGEELKEYTRIIIKEADRLRSLINRMLGPNALPQKSEINIHEVLEHVRHLVMAEVGPGVSLRFDYDPSIPELYADRDQLIQATLNLVKNAVQAVGDEGLITLRTRTLRQYTIGQTRHKLVIRIDIIDSGSGIAPDMLESIFLPMVTGRAEGTGLGLPIAQSLINLNGGLIECESRPGKTTFTVLLPFSEQGAVDSPTPQGTNRMGMSNE